MVLRAMKHTKSNMAAARFLGCSYPHYKQYAKLYKNEEGKTLPAVWNRGAAFVGALLHAVWRAV